jgi:hypothetical protein
VPGFEKDPKVQALFQQYGSGIFTQLADAQRQGFAARGENPAKVANDGQFEPSEIQKLVNSCKDVPLFDGERSGYKDLTTTVARVCLGEIMCEVFLQVSADDIGCSPTMFKAGQEFILKRDKLVKGKAAHSQSKGKGRNSRPNLQDFSRCGLTAMCKNADSWHDQAAFTNFVATMIFSILEGHNCEHLDQLEISNADLLSSKTKKAQSVAKAKTDEEGEAATGRSQVRDGSQECDEAESRPVKKAAVKMKKQDPWPEGRRLFKEYTYQQIVDILTRCLTIMSAGGFWLLPHAHSEFEDNKLRASNERGESVLMSQVFKFVSKRLSQEKGLNPDEVECNFQNFWTDSTNAPAVKAVFSDPATFKGCRWISVDPQRCGAALGFCAGNMLHFLEKFRNAAEHLKKVREILTSIVVFVINLPSPTSLGNALSRIEARLIVVPKKRKSRKKAPGKDFLSQAFASDSPSSLVEEDSPPKSAAEPVTHLTAQQEIPSKALVEQPLTLPTPQQCAVFRGSICFQNACAVGGCASLPFGAPPSSTAEEVETVVEEGTRDTMSLDEHDLSPNLEQVEAWEEPIDTQIDALRQGLLHLTDPASLQDSRAGKPPHDTVSSDAHDFPPDLVEKCPLLFEPHLDVLSQRVFGKAMSGHQQLLEASRHGDAEKVFISSSFLPVFLHMPIPIYATRQASHFLRSPHLLISTGLSSTTSTPARAFLRAFSTLSSCAPSACQSCVPRILF